MDEMRTLEPERSARSPVVNAPHSSPMTLTRPRRSVSLGSMSMVTIASVPTRRSAPTPAGMVFLSAKRFEYFQKATQSAAPPKKKIAHWTSTEAS